MAQTTTRPFVLLQGGMSVDHSVVLQLKEEPTFLRVKPGDVVVVWDNPTAMSQQTTDWFMAEVIFCEGSARNPKAPSLFQVWNVDTGVITWVNADLVERVVMPASE